MAWRETVKYKPNHENIKVYDEPFEIFEEMHDLVGKESKAMLKLKKLRIKNDG